MGWTTVTRNVRTAWFDRPRGLDGRLEKTLSADLVPRDARYGLNARMGSMTARRLSRTGVATAW